MSPTLTVNGIPCDPAACTVVDPGHAWSFGGNVVAGADIFDTNFALQSITPPGNGGTVAVVATIDADAGSIITDIGGVNLGAVMASAQISAHQITETIVIRIGANDRSGGDFLGRWTAAPVQCVVGVPPDCRPPEMQQPIPTLGDAGVLALTVLVALVAALWSGLGAKR